MAFLASLAILQSEASCPLCLDYLRDPVTLDCGHNFCVSCIQQRWVDLQDVFPCPVCLHHCPDRNFKRNNQLCHITDIINQLPIRGNKRKQREQKLCEKHNEVLDMFCEKDFELLCPQCRAAPDHQDHHLIPAERAAASQRKKLRSYMELLKRKVETTEMDCKKLISKFLEESWNVESQKRELDPECKEFICFLRREHFESDARLILEENKEKDKLTENKSYISSHVDTHKNLLREAREKCLLPELELLSDIKSLQCSHEDVPLPAVFSYELKKESLTLPPHYFGLHKMISTFQVDLTLDPETAHPSLIVSKDRKSVSTTSLPQFLDNSQTFPPYPAVLSCEGFDGGRHFWQVEVTGEGEWSLGVCKKSFYRNSMILPSAENGCWAFLQSAKYTEQNMNGTNPGMQIGVFLDYELGELSVYNLNNKLYLCKVTDKFTEKLIPYFAIGSSSNSFSICLATKEW
ncbi:tripartite motif-containing protein 75-like [Sorex araneus]|uniref:tripartite motif-containing protein 75-like n=1 Tax=Sorex araneus TaxID=42254 RepID=UPI002433C56E|nr:tripartite motif-containing protein 75-like [Sorex araneus]